MQSENHNIEDAVQNALGLMRDSGFAVSGRVEVSIDPDLPFMGYSTQRAGGNIVVVAGKAVKSGAVDGLLIHELCHIYRTEQNHPSHNRELLNRVGYHVIHKYELTRDYEMRTIQQAVNHIQDLYADDISFQVFKKSQVFMEEQAYALFLDWINDTPLKGKGNRTRWLNVGTMLNNCFALSNITRRRIKDIDNQMEKAVERFLSQTDEDMKKAHVYFRDLMINLKEDVSEQQFEKDLTEYLIAIVKLSQKPQQ